MIHEPLLAELTRERLRDEFLYPWYGRWSIAEVVPTIGRLLGVPSPRSPVPEDVWRHLAPARHVVLFVLDGLSFGQVLDYRSRVPFLAHLGDRADIYPLTSVFPSTTPAALTTLHSGLTPQEHGLPEWTVFFEELDAIIETLPFRQILTRGRDTLLKAGGRAQMLYDGPTAYEQLRLARVDCAVFNYFEYATSAYSSATQRGATVVPYTNLTDLFTKLRARLIDARGPAYTFVYWGNIDAVMHAFGPNSPEHVAELELFFDALGRELVAKIPREGAERVVLAMTADHGHVSVKREKMIFLNRYLPLEASYQRMRSQRTIPPTGGPNDVFLFIDPGHVEETMRFLGHELEGRAEVLATKDALARGLFGLGDVSPKLSRRIGNVLVLPRPGHHVWYLHSAAAPFHQLGCHGGLSKDEMLVPFALAPLSSLV